MGNFFTTFRRLPKRTSALVAIITGVLIVPAALFAWGPSRPTYTVEHPADHVTFNSITNNPNIGDERNFVGARESGTSNLWKDNITVTKGKEYTIRMYVHNNAAANLKLVAKNVTARITLPKTTGKSIQIDGSISSSNASPTMVYDDTVLTSSENFNLAYVPNTLTFENNSYGAAGTSLPETIFDQRGALLGYDKHDGLDGKIPGCFQYAGYVTFKVKPQFAPTNTFEMKKEVRKTGDTTWQDTVATKPGDTVDYQITYKNSGEARQNDVVVKDILPAGLSYIAGSTYLKNGSNANPLKVSDNLTTSTGINVGDYASGAAAYVKFSAKVNANAKLPVCGTNKLINKAQVIVGGGSKEDTADVTVPKTCEEEKPCKYSCDSLTVKKIDRTHFTFNTTVTAQNATFKKVSYVIRNAKGSEIDRKESTARTFNYVQGTVGTFTVEALVTFTVDGKDTTVTSTSCKKPFEVTKAPTTPSYTCDSLTVKKISRLESSFTGKATVTGGATIVSYTFDFGDTKTQTVTNPTSVKHEYTKAGNYTAKLAVTVKVNGVTKTVTGAECKVKVTTTVAECKPGIPVGDSRCEEKPQECKPGIPVGDTRCKDTPECKPGVPVGDKDCEEKPECKPGIPVGDDRCIDTPSECKPGIPTGDERCTPCEVPGKENLPKNSEDCKEDEVPVELPHTGMTENLLTLLGAGSLIAAAGYYVASRRALP